MACCLVACGGGTQSEPNDRDESDSTEGDGDAPGDGDGDGDAPVGDTPCTQLIACVRKAVPETLTGVLATYGDEGTCWDLPGVAREDCHTECDAQRENLAMAYPRVGACTGREDGEVPVSLLTPEEYEALCKHMVAVFDDSAAATGLCMRKELEDGLSCSSVRQNCMANPPEWTGDCHPRVPPRCDSVMQSEVVRCFADNRARYQELAGLNACSAEADALAHEPDACGAVYGKCPKLWEDVFPTQ